MGDPGVLALGERAVKNPWLTAPNDADLRCLAFGHAWERPEFWTQWMVGNHEQQFVYTIRTRRHCGHGCGAEQRTTMNVRTSLRGNIVEVLSTRHRIVWSLAKVLKGTPRPSRKEFQLALITRQLSTAVKGTGTKMRRADAAANIHVMLKRR